MARWRIAAGVGIVAVLAVVTAFVVADALRGEPEVIASEPGRAAPSASATPTSDPDPMPELHNTGDDFDRIIRSIEEFRGWLYRNPQPELVGKIYHESCECHAEMTDRLRRLREAGYRVSEGGASIIDVVVLDRTEVAVALKVVDVSHPTVVMDDATGEVVDADEGRSEAAFRVLLVREGERWLVNDLRNASMDLAPRVES